MSGTDPTYISSMEHFESMSHEEIHAKTREIDAGEILRASGVWLEAAATLASAMPLTRAAADRVMNSMEWEGAAAEAAYTSTRSFAASVEELSAVMGEVGARLGAVAAAAETVKLAVVPPGDSGPVGAIARLLEAAKVIDAQMMQEALRQEAVLAMNMVYKPAYSAAGTGVPALPDPPGTMTVPDAGDALPQPGSTPGGDYSSPGAAPEPDGAEPPLVPEGSIPPETASPEAGSPAPAPDGTGTPSPESGTPAPSPTEEVPAPDGATPTPEAPAPPSADPAPPVPPDPSPPATEAPTPDTEPPESVPSDPPTARGAADAGLLGLLGRLQPVVDGARASGRMRPDVAVDLNNHINNLRNELVTGHAVDADSRVEELRRRIDTRLRERALTPDAAAELTRVLDDHDG